MEERCAGSGHPQKNRGGGASQAEEAMLELPEVCGMIIYYTKELGVREARDKEAFLLAATLPKSLTLYPTLRRPKLA